MRNPVFGVSDTKRTVLPLNMLRGLKFQIYKVEGLYTVCSKNKSTDCTVICIFGFAYAQSVFLMMRLLCALNNLCREDKSQIRVEADLLKKSLKLPF